MDGRRPEFAADFLAYYDGDHAKAFEAMSEYAARMQQTVDIIADPEWHLDVSRIREIVGVPLSYPFMDLAAFWQWRSEAWSAGWLMREPEATVLEWWVRWEQGGRYEGWKYWAGTTTSPS